MLSVRPGRAVSGVGIWALEAMSPILLLTKWRQTIRSLEEEETIEPAPAPTHPAVCPPGASAVSLASYITDLKATLVQLQHVTQVWPLINRRAGYYTVHSQIHFTYTNTRYTRRKTSGSERSEHGRDLQLMKTILLTSLLLFRIKFRSYERRINHTCLLCLSVYILKTFTSM